MRRRPPALAIAFSEARILAPLWLAGLAAIAAATWMNAARPLPVEWLGWGFVAYALTPVAIGATAFGHDFSHRTMVLALSQPVARTTLLTTRTAVVVIMVTALAAGAALLVSNASRELPFDVTTALLVPALAGICLAPALTLLTRSALAGLVFGIALPLFILMAAELVAGMRYGFTPDVSMQARTLRDSIALSGFYVMCAMALPAIWYLSSRSEALEGPARAAGLPHRAGLGRGARTHPALALVITELHLQQGVLAFSVLAGCAIAPVVLLAGDALWLDAVVVPVVVLHGALVALLAGALASAEERQLGTIGWQVMLPFKARWQWTIKAAVASSVAVALGYGLPLALSVLVDSPELRRELRNSFDEQALFPLLGATTCALYVSTLVASGVRALVTSLFAIAGAMLVLGPPASWTSAWLGQMIGAGLARALPGPLTGGQLRTFLYLLQPVAALMILSWLVLALSFARQNHESADRSARRVVRHVAWLFAAAVVGIALLEGSRDFLMAARAALRS